MPALPHRLAIVTCLLGTMTSHARAELPTYSTIVLQARSASDTVPAFNLADTCSLLGQTPALSQSGAIACRLLKPAGDAVFLGPGNATGTLIINGNDEFTDNIAISDQYIALGRLLGGAEVRTHSGSLVLTYPATNGAPTTLVSAIHLTSNQDIAYRNTALGTQQLVTDSYNGNTRTTNILLQTGGDISAIFPPAFGSGKAAAVVSYNDSTAALVSIGTGPPQVIGQTLYTEFAAQVGTNANAAIVFAARRASDQIFELAVHSSSGIQTFAQVGSLGIVENAFVPTAPRINTSNLVAFRARDAIGDAIFITDGSSIARVIGDGDTIQSDLGPLTIGFDSPLDGRQSFSGGIALNDAGKLAFNAYLSNGTQGLFIAHPDPTTPTCPADIDDGSQTGTSDNAVTIDDLLYFLISFEEGSTGADLDDDGQDPANPDGAVTIDDLLFMLVHFEAGC